MIVTVALSPYTSVRTTSSLAQGSRYIPPPRSLNWLISTRESVTTKVLVGSLLGLVLSITKSVVFVFSAYSYQLVRLRTFTLVQTPTTDILQGVI